VLVRLATEYDAPPLVVHENGGAFPDAVGPDGVVDDGDRLGFLAAHVAACEDALAAGVDLRGYFVWSLLDNFEWAEGYGHRFGIVHVDYATQARTPKASARWFSRVVAAHGLPDDGPAGGDGHAAGATEGGGEATRVGADVAAGQTGEVIGPSRGPAAGP
jgi:beta-glucosidase